jgi:hypothetical protein
MATPVGTNTLNSITRRYIMPMIVDNIYNSNPIFYRLYKANKKIVQGGTQIEVPLMYKRFTTGGSYSGYAQLDTAPQDTVKNGAWDWKQKYVTVAVDGLTLIKNDSPDAIANYLRFYFAQAELEMCENLATGLWSDGSVSDSEEIDGLEAAVDDGGVATSYAGLTRSSNTYLNAQDDSTTATLTPTALQSLFGNVTEGGRHPTLIVSRQEQYNRYWALNQLNQDFPVQPSGHDEQLASAGFTNLLFNGVPWVVDSHVFDGANASNSAVVMLNEDYIHLAVSPRADFYQTPFQEPVNQDAMVSKLLWAGNLIVVNTQRQGKLSALTA